MQNCLIKKNGRQNNKRGCSKVVVGSNKEDYMDSGREREKGMSLLFDRTCLRHPNEKSDACRVSHSTTFIDKSIIL